MIYHFYKVKDGKDDELWVHLSAVYQHEIKACIIWENHWGYTSYRPVKIDESIEEVIKKLREEQDRGYPTVVPLENLEFV